ncbi:Major facilitator superfamily domain, general substrate transporter [Niveomyces insectorum RCEF 264]|uniref:Major facilitator superfamily domain, general substrate transporter n=1 Tax=Niveomyces insectorum RCEF 264 TaxID=1081102 RepID=A0A167MM43_9HYPO|nr:Major facilitator superfamily domain, general substrate transporter [Niveomyces insectorum RCEF 264]
MASNEKNSGGSSDQEVLNVEATEETGSQDKPTPQQDPSTAEVISTTAATPDRDKPAGRQPSPPPPAPPPDGGLLAWLQVLGSWFLFMNSWGLVNTYGVFQTYYELTLLPNKTPSDIAWVGSLQACLLLVVGVVTGPLFDLGYFNLLLWTGSVLVVFGMMMTSLCTQYWQVMLAQGLVVGIGFGCLFVPSVAIVSTYFTTRKAFATGIAASGSSLGGVLYSIAFSRLQPRIGFPWATRVLGFLALAGLLVCCAVMRVRVLPKSTRQLLEPRAFREVPYTAFTVSQLVGTMGIWVPFYYVQTYAIEVAGTDASLAFYLVTLLNAASILGRLVPNYLADKTGPLNIMTVAAFCSAVLAFAWIGITTTAGLIVFCVLYGFTSGSFVSLPAPTVVSLSPSLNVVGARMGMSFSLAGIGILIGNPIGGAILGSASGWTGLQAWAGATIVCAGVASLVARVAKNPKLLGKA